MVVHHLNKMQDPNDPFDAFSGSTGLTGGVDGVMILNRERGKADAFLYVDGRDIENQGEHPLKWNHDVCSWTLSDGEPIEYRMTDERAHVYNALPDYDDTGIGPKAIALATGTTEESIRYLLGKMVAAGEVEKAEYGKYTKPYTPSHSSQSSHC